MFSRIKRFQNREYIYLVENRRINGKVCQSVVKYLGKARKNEV